MNEFYIPFSGVVGLRLVVRACLADGMFKLMLDQLKRMAAMQVCRKRRALFEEGVF